METPTSTRPGSLDVPQKSSTSTPRVARKLKTDSDSVSSPNPVSKTPKNTSPKIVDRRSPRNLAIEKKKPIKVSELETQVSHLQDELKKAKDQLASTESLKRRAEHDAEEARKHLTATSAKLEQTHNQLKELSESDDTRIQELRKLSQDRDRAWQSELEALQKQHSVGSAALSSAMNEVQKLKGQLERVSQSEASHARHAESAHAEIQCLRVELSETLDLVEKLKGQLSESRENEMRAGEEVKQAEAELDVVRSAEEKLRAERDGAVRSYENLVLELEESRNRVKSLEVKISSENGECDESKIVKNEADDLKNEVDRLRAELEAAEKSYRDEYIQSTLEIRNAYELVEQAKSESCKREAELEAKLNKSKSELEELRAKLSENENAIQIKNNEQDLKSEENEENQENELESELKKLESTLQDLKANLSEKESQLQTLVEENETLRSEIKKKETERSKAYDEALMKLSSLTEEAVKSSRKAERVAEELDATQASNSELEAELRRLKVQSDQWRKAAEAAAAMLSTVSNGKCVERTGSMEYHTIGRKMGFENLDDTDDDESPKKRNGNVLRKIGVLLKKGQK